MTLLRIDASVRTDGSLSRARADLAEAALSPASVTRRDLAAEALPQIDAVWAEARLRVPADLGDDERAALALSDELIAELRAADTILISTPVYNFGVPASLKAWMDLVARPKVTFAYTEGGPVGLLEGKRAIISIASGGTEIDGTMDYATPHLRHFLGFLGITDVTVLAADADVAALAAPAAA